MIVCALMACLCACGSKPCATICGVPVQGTPLQLAASIEANGDGTFRVDAVHISFGKAQICGWSLLSDRPDTLCCDLSLDHNQVTHTVWTSEMK